MSGSFVVAPASKIEDPQSVVKDSVVGIKQRGFGLFFMAE